MSETDEPKVVYTCDFCKQTTDEVEDLIAGRDGTPIICDRCVRYCEAVLQDAHRPLECYCRIPGRLHDERSMKLRPVTRIPKTWMICETDLYCSTPNVTACSPTGRKTERFAIPRQLAQWMIVKSEKLDLEELREKMKDDIARTVREVLGKY